MENFIESCIKHAVKNQESIERWIMKIENSCLGRKKLKHYTGCLLRALGYDVRTAYIVKTKSAADCGRYSDNFYLERGEIKGSNSFEEELLMFLSRKGV